MKKLMIGLSLMFGMLISSVGFSQLNVQVNLNSQPDWGPAGHQYVEYYYLPDVDMYYHVNKHQYVYLNQGKWVRASSMPSKYRGYNLYSGYKVVIHESNPFAYHKSHKVKYAKYKGYHGKQKVKKGYKAHPQHHAHPQKKGGHPSNGHGGKDKGGKGKGHK